MTVEKVEDVNEKKTSLEHAKIKKAVVHPLVLLGVVDHYSRSGKASSGRKRVVGCLLGSLIKGVLDISNSFAVPFEEDLSDPDVWFLDHNYLENMFSMFKKVNAREKIVGWYHSGPKLCRNDIKINELFRKYAPNSVLVVVDVKRDEQDGLPTEAYIAVEEVHDDGTPTCKTFDRLTSEIGAEEAEEVGVEHLLRDIKDSSIGTLSQRIGYQLEGLSGLLRQLNEIKEYLDLVVSHQIPINHTVIYQLQDIFNLLPDLRLQDTIRAIHVNTNDQMLVIYVAAIVRCTMALHDLINNKLTNREFERNEEVGSTDQKKSAAGDQAKHNTTKSDEPEDKKSGEAEAKSDSSDMLKKKPKKS